MSFTSNASSAPYDVLIKVMMLGHSSVGKSSMISSLAQQPFTPSHLHTIGIDFKIKNYDIKGKRVKVQIWDSAGQERYDTIIKPYYREAQAFILVFDLTNRQTFDELPRWLENIQLNSTATEDLVLILAGNKCDLSGRPVDQELINHLCTIHSMTYYESSAKTRHNIDKMFYDVTEQVLKKRGLDYTLTKSDTVRLQRDQVVMDEEEEHKHRCCSIL